MTKVEAKFVGAFVFLEAGGYVQEASALRRALRDKERLDWLVRNEYHVGSYQKKYFVQDSWRECLPGQTTERGDFIFTSPRRAIDAAMGRGKGKP